nr:MAG TPA: hypothetical protein [Caudoviricetes sp.]
MRAVDKWGRKYINTLIFSPSSKIIMINVDSYSLRQAPS